LGAGRTTTWAYDKENNPTQVVSARSNATNMAFDGLNRLVSAALPGGGTEGQAYTAQDDLASNSDAISVATTYVRNGFGEAIQEVSPDRGTSVYYYDAAGRVSAAIDGRGQRIDFARDVLGRVTSKTPVGRPASEVISYAYDDTTLSPYQKGRLSKVIDGSGTSSFAYDHRGNLVVKRQPVGATASAKLGYSYDLADRVTEIQYPSGRLVGYVRDSKGRVVTIQTKATAATTSWTYVASGMTYDPFGSLNYATLGNTLTMTNNWGNDGRLASRRLKTSTGANRSFLQYAYDNDDNITGITDAVTAANSISYAYDVRGRLSRTTAAATSSATYKRTDFAHDANGNRTSVERRLGATDASAAQTDSYSKTAGTNRLASIMLPAGTRSFTYDNRGNPSAESRPGSVAVSVGYDGYARLTSYTRTGDATQTNVYNGLDQRVSITSGTTTRRFVYDPDGRVLGEYGTSATNVIAERIWMTPEIDDGGMFGGDDGTGGYAPIAIVNGTTLSWVHGNHLGVPILYTNSTGAVITTPAYTLPGFPGQLLTPGLGGADLYYNLYRDYDPTTGRYLQADPIGLAGDANPYLYAMGNPVRYTDPTGEFGVVGAFFGGGIDLAIQVLVEGKSLRCVDLKRLAISAAAGALGAPAWARFGARGLAPGMSRLNAAFPRGLEWVERSHFIPERWGGTFSKYNINLRWGTDHALSDASRYRFLPKVWKADNPLPNAAERFWDRLPDWSKGATIPSTAASAGQSIGSKKNCKCD
jgi:RHS repeat-associated protein